MNLGKAGFLDFQVSLLNLDLAVCLELLELAEPAEHQANREPPDLAELQVFLDKAEHQANQELPGKAELLAPLGSLLNLELQDQADSPRRLVYLDLAEHLDSQAILGCPVSQDLAGLRVILGLAEPLEPAGFLDLVLYQEPLAFQEKDLAVHQVHLDSLDFQEPSLEPAASLDFQVRASAVSLVSLAYLDVLANLEPADSRVYWQRRQSFRLRLKMLKLAVLHSLISISTASMAIP